jgi:molecular chaperone DnaK
MSAVVGIDLGTSTTCIATVQKGEISVIPDEKGRRITPSYVMVDAENAYQVGYFAKAQAVSHPLETIYAVKRLMGQRFQSVEVQAARRRLSYPVVEGAPGEVRIQIRDRQISPVEISAEILRAVKTHAERFLGEPVDKAVITVPAHFNDRQRKATKAAGEAAGLDVLRLINEPTAAALAYGFGSDSSQRIAVYDFGGGTFDISILNLGDQVYEVLATNGDSYLGGEDINNRVVEYLVGEFKRIEKIDLAQNKMSMQRVIDAAERAKIELSQEEATMINLPRIAPYANPSAHLVVELTRGRLESLVGDLVERSLDIVQTTLDLARLAPEDIDEVVLVGGQTRMPFVQRKVQEFFGKKPNRSFNPEEVVAVGAAIQANALVSQTEEILLLDVTPMTLGIAAFGDMFSVLIEKNTKVPKKAMRVFTTNSDFQERVKIIVLQGENRRASMNQALAEFTLEGIRQARRMEPKIEVAFKVDANGILSVSARDMDSGLAQNITIRDYVQRAEERKGSVLGDVPGDDMPV